MSCHDSSLQRRGHDASFSRSSSYLLQLYIYILIAAAVLSWLVAFNVVNTRNPFVAPIGEFLYRITEPVLRPIRNMLPNLGGIDISPVIVILIIIFIQAVVISESAETALTAASVARPWTIAPDGVILTVRLTPKGGRDAIDGIETLSRRQRGAEGARARGAE